MATPQQLAQQILSLFVSSGARTFRAFPILVNGPPLSVSRFPGAVQEQFLSAYQSSPQQGINDLTAGLAYAVQQGWLSISPSNPDPSRNLQMYELEQAGFSEAGGTVPTQAAAAQQLINVVTALNSTPGAAQFNLDYIASSFVGTVGGNTFAPEDLIPGYGYAVAEGWVRPILGSGFGNVFSLTAAGAAQAT